MKISVRAFASYREAIGERLIPLDVSAGSTPAQVWEVLRARYPRLSALPTPFAYAINDEYVPADKALRERDELVLVPPVSGGADVELVEHPIDITALLDRVKHAQAGAVVIFLGTVRDNREGQRVHHLEYEAYPRLAMREMERVAGEVANRWPTLRIAMIHRLGTLKVGEVSVAVAVSSAHRKDAFEAGKFAIDSLKQTVPIWKKEVWEGGEVWVG